MVQSRRYACVFVCMCMRMHMCVYIYICVFFCSECCVHFGSGVLGTSTCADVYVIQAFVGHQRTHLRNTRCRVCTYSVYVHIYMYAHAYVYGYVCTSMILLEALKRRCCDFLSVYRCAYTYICICVCIYACMCACAYVCICMYVCLCICMHIHVYIHACGCKYALV